MTIKMSESSIIACLPRIVVVILIISSFVAVNRMARAEGAHSTEGVKWGEPLGGLQISVHAEEERVDSGSPIACRITLKNVGLKTFKYVVNNTMLMYDFTVTDENDAAMPFTRYGQLIHKPTDDDNVDGEAINVVNLQPGEEGTPIRFPISMVYDVSVPGTYRIVVKLKIPNNKGGAPFELSSNTVTVKVEGFDGSMRSVPDPSEAKNTK